MTEQTARTAASIVIGAAAAGALYLILRDPRLRRAAAQAARLALTSALPAYLQREVRQAWAASSPV